MIFSSRYFMRHYSHGTATVEYAIPATLVVGALVLALNAGGIQNMVSPWFQNTVNANGNNVQSYGTSSTLSSVGGATVQLDPVTGLPVIPPPDVGQEQVCFNSGLCVNIPVISTGNVIETSATSGAWITQLAGVITQIAQQIQLSQGNSPLTAVLLQLANTANDMGYTMQNMPSNGMVSFDGVNYVGNNPTGEQIVDGMYSISSSNQQFTTQLQAFNNLLASEPALSQAYPELSGLINHEAGIIQSLAQGVVLVSNSPDCPGGVCINHTGGLQGTGPNGGPGKNDGPVEMSPNVETQGIESSTTGLCNAAGGCAP